MTFEGERGDDAIQLPAREAEILGLAAKGLTDKQISAELGISRDTVSTYWRRILLRYQAANRTEVVARAIQSQLKQKLDEAERMHERLQSEIHQRNQADGVGAASSKLLHALHDSLLAFVSQSKKPEKIFLRLLEEMVEATDSEFGFISELEIGESGPTAVRNLALSNISWDESSKSTYEKDFMEEWQPWDDKSLSAAVHAHGKTLVINDFSGHTGAAVPKGHRSIECFLGLPIFEQDDLVGIMGVANRRGGYDESALPDLAPLATTCAAMIASLRQEDRKTS